MGEIVYFILIGGFAGVLAGLLGVGGGLVIVPLLAIILDRHGFPAGEVMRVAVATSLGSIVLTSLSSAYAHHSRGAVHWPVVMRLGLGLAVGAFCASYLVGVLPEVLLRLFFVCFAVMAAYQLYSGIKPKASRNLPGCYSLAGVGGLFGVFSGLIGIGGGTLVVPFLVWCNVGIRHAVATASACGFFIGAPAACGFVFFVTPERALPEGSVGYLYLPALISIGLMSMLMAPLGARLAHGMATEKLKRLFALVLVVMAALMLVD